MRTQDFNPTDDFLRKRDARISANKNDRKLQDVSSSFLREMVRTEYSFNFTWLGRPIIQIPQDMFVLQEIIWSVKPDFIIETGIAHGGSLIFYASILELIGKGKVIGIDINIRDYNRKEIEKHPMIKRIEMIQGSSVSPDVADQVKKIAGSSRNAIVCLDSDHTHAHVLQELVLYTPYVAKGSYCVVFDTGVEDLPKEMIKDRPWGFGNSPKSAVREFLKTNDEFIIDKDIEARILVSAAPDGYLKRVK